MVPSLSAKDNIEKKEAIIKVAQEQFGLYGYKKTSMMEIADALGMSKGLLYYYFPDKEHLYTAVVEKEFMEFKKELKDIPGLKQFFKLSPPVKGFERMGIKKPFSLGGSLGYRKEKINELLARMM